MTDLFGALRVPDSDGRIRVSLNKTIVIVIAFLALGWGLGAEKDGGTKIGIVDLDQAVGSTDEGKAAQLIVSASIAMAAAYLM